MTPTDTWLKKIALLLFFLSFLLLLYMDSFAELPSTEIEKLSRADLNKQVKVQGTLIEQKRYEEHLFLTILENNSLLLVAVFYAENNLSLGKQYSIEGRVSLNKNEIQVIANKITP